MVVAKRDTSPRLKKQLMFTTNAYPRWYMAEESTPYEENAYTDHDRLFKQLIETFFEDFMRLYFPEIDPQIDYKCCEFIPQELFTDITGGEKRVVDLLVKTKLHSEEGMILIHIENQAYVQTDFCERMFLYFSRLYEKYRCKIIPIALFSYDKIRDEPDHFVMEFPFIDVLQFRFYTIELKK